MSERLDDGLRSPVGVILATGMVLVALVGMFQGLGATFWVFFMLVAASLLVFLTSPEEFSEWMSAEGLRMEFGGAEQDEPIPEADDPEVALQVARQRYAAGKLDDEAFERVLEQLLETETVADAREHVRRAREVETAAE
jgi:uncharacterized membrane protein